MFGFRRDSKKLFASEKEAPEPSYTMKDIPSGANAIKFDSAPPQYREDFWDYDSKGITPSRFGDTRPQMTNENFLDYDILDHLYHTSGIAHKVVSKPAEDATRNGWRIVIPDDPDKQEQYQAALDALNLKQVLAQELIYQRLHGDGYINIGLDENKASVDLTAPVDPQQVNKIAFVHAFGQEHVQYIETGNDPTRDDYMKEQRLMLIQVKGGTQIDKQGNTVMAPVTYVPVVIDHSRYFHIALDRLEDDDTGTSILTRCYDQIKTLDTALYSVGKLIYAYDINVLYDEGSPNLNDPESDEQARAQNEAVKQGMGTDSVLNLHNGQRFERVSTNVSGLEQLLTFAWQNLAAASNIPKSVLLGEQAGTLAGATQDVANYYDGVKAIQEELLRPQLEQIIKLLMWSNDVADGQEDPDSINWKLQFNPLWSADDKTQSETDLNHANAAAIKVNAGIIDADEAKEELAGQNNNNVQSMQTKTDADDISIEDAKELEKRLERAIHGQTDTTD